MTTAALLSLHKVRRVGRLERNRIEVKGRPGVSFHLEAI